jgi:N-acyl-D-aspartate/D-glutamate deacylase
MGPIELAHDFPGGEWRRVQKADGYSYMFVNGQMTMDHGRETGNMSGRLLRHGAA